MSNSAFIISHIQHFDALNYAALVLVAFLYGDIGSREHTLLTSANVIPRSVSNVMLYQWLDSNFQENTDSFFFSHEAKERYMRRFNYGYN